MSFENKQSNSCISEILGTLDINICEIKNRKLAIKAVNGNEHLGEITFNILFIICRNLHLIGGQDFDGIIMNYALRKYMESSNNDVFGNKRLVKRLRTECRSAKEALSFNTPSYNIHVSVIKNNRSSEL